jgi:hypothetical protein
VVGGAAFGFAAGIIQFLAYRAQEEDKWVHRVFLCLFMSIFRWENGDQNLHLEKNKAKVEK